MHNLKDNGFINFEDKFGILGLMRTPYLQEHLNNAMQKWDPIFIEGDPLDLIYEVFWNTQFDNPK